VLATGFVLFTLFFNGTTLRPLIRALGLDRLSPRDAALRDQVLALSYEDARDKALAIADAHGISRLAVERVIGPYEAQIVAAEAEAAAVQNLTDIERLIIALVALGNQERVVTLAMLRDRIASAAAVQVLLGKADAIAEAARNEGRLGYRRAGQAALGYSVAFRLAYFLYRRLGLVRPLANRLAERVELLLIMRLVVERLSAFTAQEIKPIFGDRIAAIAAEMLEQRRKTVVDAIEAMRLQYPEYIIDLEARFLRQSALRQEMTRHQSLFEEGLITREVFEELRRETSGARATEMLPRFDIGLDTRHLIARLDILAGLDERQLDQVGRLLRPRLAIPGEVIIRKGERGDAVFFLASGAAEVVLPRQRVRLGSGEFFGEMALLSGRPRQADVVALSYCQLLVLRRSDFERFMTSNPETRETITRVAAARRAMNDDTVSDLAAGQS